LADPREHFILHDTKQVIPYKPVTGGGSSAGESLPDHVEHAAYLERQFQNVWAQDAQQKAIFAAINGRGGTYIEFTSSPERKLKLESLENIPRKIKLLNVKIIKTVDSKEIQKATVFVPDETKSFFTDEIEKYKQEPEEGKSPKNEDSLSRIDKVDLSLLTDLWLDKDPIPETPAWCEIWIAAEVGKEDSAAEKYFQLCDSLHIRHSSKFIIFPEKIVTLCLTDKKNLQNIINTDGLVSEIHLYHEPASFFVRESMAGNQDREQWITDIKNRITSSEKRSRICILDTGLNRHHPLLEDVTTDNTVQKADPNWPTAADINGHGTEMAGVCEYFDLGASLESSGSVQQNIDIESVKILQDKGTNDPELYGQITNDAVNTAQSEVADNNRVHCMAVTVRDNSDEGKPTSWSAKVDNIISGYEDSRKKLIIISAGNVDKSELLKSGYPKACYVHSVESPAQSWNALTVGAVNTKVWIKDSNLKDYRPVAESGDLCPFSSTTNNTRWGQNWPVKPEVLFEGGNAVTDGHLFDSCDDLSILTTHHLPLARYFTTINATSAATAQASYVAAQIYAQYPDVWPETVRGLIVHSAEWTDKMLTKFPHMNLKTDGIWKMLHTYGYGVADLSRARDSFNNSAVMIIQDELQPFIKKEGQSSAALNEMHLHILPWPKEFLSSLGDIKVRMKITLSYFVDAAPDRRGWKSRYRYESAGLRFNINNAAEDKDDFLKRINKYAWGEDGKDKGNGKSTADNWMLGSDNRDVGSIHSDYWEGAAAILADSEYIAVYPVSGWWKDRTKLRHFNDKLQYSLIVSLSTDDEKIDIYNEIKTIIDNRIKTPVEISFK
jgi:hypothetical protein